MSSDLIGGQGRNIESLFENRIYALGYFQRDYVWNQKEIDQLLGDLEAVFISEWRPRHERKAVRKYEPYFLGPFVTYETADGTFLTDGQQRFVTLLILLMYVRRLLIEREDSHTATHINGLIGKYSFDRFQFLVKVDDYGRCFDAFYHGRTLDVQDEAPKVQRLWAACQHLETGFPEALREEALPFFADWLCTRVSMIEIMAGKPERAWVVFQSMNDRGVHLTSMDLLKGYLLDRVEADERERLRDVWNTLISRLESQGRQREWSDVFVQALLRARFAPVNEVGEIPAEHLRLIDSAPHEWIRKHSDLIWPTPKDGDAQRFIVDLLVPLVGAYTRIRAAASNPTKALDAVYFNHANGLAKQFDLTLAALQPTDARSVAIEKARIVANFVDCTSVLHTINNRQGSVQSRVDLVTQRLLRRARTISSTGQLRNLLADELAANQDNFAALESFRLRDNGPFVRYLLARLTAWLECGSERTDPLFHYLSVDERGPTHQTEHLWPSKGPMPLEQMASEEFATLRNRFGALVLLQRDENASMRDQPLSDKVKWYLAHNILAGSLDGEMPRRGLSRYRSFVRREGLVPLITSFTGDFVELVDARSRLYRAIAQKIWAPSAMGLSSVSKSSVAPKGVKAAKTRTHYEVDFQQLVLDGAIPVGTILTGTHRGRTHTAEVLSNGRIRTSDGASFDTPSRAAMNALNRSSYNGWIFWFAEVQGLLKRIDDIRASHSPGGDE